jgi:hypothetical protein
MLPFLLFSPLFYLFLSSSKTSNVTRDAPDVERVATRRKKRHPKKDRQHRRRRRRERGEGKSSTDGRTYFSKIVHVDIAGFDNNVTTTATNGNIIKVFYKFWSPFHSFNGDSLNGNEDDII